MLQYKGVSQGVFIDPDTMTPLVGSPAVLTASQWLKDLGPYSLPTTCFADATEFAQGRCLLSLGWAAHFKVGDQCTTGAAQNRSCMHMHPLTRCIK
jgi:hypothetical protein